MSDYKLGIENDKLRILLNDYENELSRIKRESKEKIQDLEERLKLKTTNEVNASVNADCLEGCRVKLKRAESKLKKAVEALRFYGDTSENTWLCQLSNTTRKPISYVIGIDCDELENGFVNGGRLARKTLEEIGE